MDTQQDIQAQKGNIAAEAAGRFFDEVGEALGRRPDFRAVYLAVNQAYKRLLNQLTAGRNVRFGGDFAKTDYLLKENGAPRWLSAAANETRVRLRRRYELTAAQQEQWCLHDVGNLCQFAAFVSRTPIPGRLAAMLPPAADRRREAPPQAAPGGQTSAPLSRGRVTDVMRVVVERWDADALYVRSEEDDALLTVRYGHWQGKAYDYDWTYLNDLLRPGTQLNLVRPWIAGAEVRPELIILEPDYLVNISTVAHCFTNYADSPMVELIKKLEPQQATEATVLGALAGQLLDETIHTTAAEEHSYADTVRTFYKDHAVSLLQAGVGEQFHKNGRLQRQHIEEAIRRALPSRVAHFQPAEGIVEPSFFSEMLGLQGRMDYLQMDMRVLMEQKSGKGAFPYDGFTTPRQTDEHYVQMLLYMALVRYNYRELYERNGRELHAFLLYSKYSESLLGLGFAPELIFKAIRVRNRLVSLELDLLRPDAYRLLERLTPEALNEKHAANTLWTNWQRPQIAAVLDPIRQASELERAYYFRFLTFIANEHAMSKLGSRVKENAGFAATWLDSLDDKRQAGNIYDRLTLVSPDSTTTGRVDSVVLSYEETETSDMSNFRVGDIVILYPYTAGREPDARRTMVMRCTIEALRPGTIRLALRAVQTDSRIFLAQEGRLWAIEHDFMESSYSSLYKGMQAFLTAPQERRDLLLLQREPQTDPSLTLRGSYGSFDDLALRVKQARDLFLIIGPPGTGKTSFGLLNTVKEELLEPGTSVLLLSYTNRAVDEICSKLAQEQIDFIRIGGRFSCADEYRDRLLNERVGQSGNLADLRRTLLTTRVFVGTTTALNSHQYLLRMKSFSLAVIDEASQILEPHLIGLLSAHDDAGVPAIRKIVLIGDHKQLPAVVAQDPAVSRVDDPLLNGICLTDCRLSLFERLLRRYARNAAVTYMLKRQGRMHHDIAQFPSVAFYAGQLQEVPLPHQTAALPPVGSGGSGLHGVLASRRIAFINAGKPVASPSDKVNQVEADLIAAMVADIYNREQGRGFDVARTVGVIVPYRNQIATVRKAIDRYGIPLLHDITIDTVERYQGSQRRYIIYGFTVQQRYQLDFLASDVFRDDYDGCTVDRRLNVAMTRAEEHLVMVGNADLLATNDVFARLIDFLRQRDCFFEAGGQTFTTGSGSSGNVTGRSE